MSYIHVNTDVDIELTECEKDHLIQAYRILKELSRDMWDEGLDEAEEYHKIYDARECMESVLRNCLKIDDI